VSGEALKESLRDTTALRLSGFRIGLKPVRNDIRDTTALRLSGFRIGLKPVRNDTPYHYASHQNKFWCSDLRLKSLKRLGNPITQPTVGFGESRKSLMTRKDLTADLLSYPPDLRSPPLLRGARGDLIFLGVRSRPFGARPDATTGWPGQLDVRGIYPAGASPPPPTSQIICAIRSIRLIGDLESFRLDSGSRA